MEWEISGGDKNLQSNDEVYAQKVFIILTKIWQKSENFEEK